MNVVVYGAGAIGGYLGGRLALAGHRVTLVTRPAVAATLNAAGLRITQDGATETAQLRAVGRLAEAFDGPWPELIVLGMKAYDLAAAVADLRAVCPQPAMLLTTQNGIGVEEIVAAPFGAERVLAGTLTIPISRAGAAALAVAVWIGPTTLWEMWLNPPADTAVGTLRTLGVRRAIWPWGATAVGDFPFTGVGLGAFRQVVFRLYPLPPWPDCSTWPTPSSPAGTASAPSPPCCPAWASPCRVAQIV